MAQAKKILKVMFLFQGLPHYYNYVLSRLHAIPQLEIINVVPKETRHVGAGVYQTEEGAEFRIIKLEEYIEKGGYPFLRNLSKIIWQERPNVIVTIKPFLKGFRSHLPTVLAMRLLGVKLILKDHPFRMLSFKEFKKQKRKEAKQKGRELFPLRKIADPLQRIFRWRQYAPPMRDRNALQIASLEMVEHQYRAASLLKGEGRYHQAYQKFEALFNYDLSTRPSLEAGIYFHLAEITKHLGASKQSQTFLRYCLYREPLHYQAGCLLHPRLYRTLHALARLVNFVQEPLAIFEERALNNLPHAHVHYVEEGKELYHSYGVPKKKIFTTYNSPDTDRLLNFKNKIELEEPSLEQKPYRLVHVGRLVPWKRVDLLIRAFAGVKKEIPKADLLIIGYGPEEEALKKLAEDLGVADAVQFLGGIYDPYELGKHLLSSAVYVLAGMGGISINEAMCFNLPVICSVCDGTEKRLVRDEYNGKFFKEGNQEDLTRKILCLLKNPTLCEKMGLFSGEIIRKEMNINTVLYGYLNAFRFVISGKPFSMKAPPKQKGGQGKGDKKKDVVKNTRSKTLAPGS